MKFSSTIAFSALYIGLAACDPGITIRQRADSPESLQTQRAGAVDVQVAEATRLIGENWFLPDTTFANRGSTGLTVTRAELVGSSGVTASHPAKLSDLPVLIPAGQSRRISPWFTLKQAVYEEFSAPVELRLYYTDGKTEHTAIVMLEVAKHD